MQFKDAKSYHRDPNTLKSEGRIQIWSCTGTFIGTWPWNVAKQNVIDGLVWVINDQAVEQYEG